MSRQSAGMNQDEMRSAIARLQKDHHHAHLILDAFEAPVLNAVTKKPLTVAERIKWVFLTRKERSQ